MLPADNGNTVALQGKPGLKGEPGLPGIGERGLPVSTAPWCQTVMYSEPVLVFSLTFLRSCCIFY